MGSIMPQIPVFAIWFSEGLRAVSKGVFQPNSLIGLSAIPSPITRTAFNVVHAFSLDIQVWLSIVKTLAVYMDPDYTRKDVVNLLFMTAI